MKRVLSFLIFSFMQFTTSAIAAEDIDAITPAKAKVLFHLQAEKAEDAWIAAGIEAQIVEDLSSHSKIEPAFLPFSKSCVDVDCQIRKLAELNIDILFRGIWQGADLSYNVYLSKTSRLVSSGKFSFGSAYNASALKIKVYQALKPAVEQRVANLSTQPNETKTNIERNFFPYLSGVDNLVDPIRGAFSHGLFLGFLIFCIFLWGWVTWSHYRAGAYRSSSRFIQLSAKLFLLAVYAGIFWFVAMGLSEEAFAKFHLSQLMPLFGGILWGLTTVLVLGFAMPGIKAFDGMTQKDLPLILQAWSRIVVGRVLALGLFFSPACLLAMTFIYIFELSSSVGWYLAVPAVLVAYLFVCHLILETAVGKLDRYWTEGEGEHMQVMDQEIREYLSHYLNRHGKALDSRLLGRVRFVSHLGPGIATYGAPFGQARIAISDSLIGLGLNHTHPNWMEMSPAERAPHHRDFFYGLLLHELAKVEAKSHWFDAFALTFGGREIALTASYNYYPAPLKLISQFQNRPHRLYRDMFVKLHGGLDHYIQFLYHRTSGRKLILTQKADINSLQETTSLILGRLVRDWQIIPASGDTEKHLRNLSQRLIPTKKDLLLAKQNQTLKWAIVAFVSLIFVSQLIFQSVSYNRVYEARIAEQQEKIDEAKRKKGALSHER